MNRRAAASTIVLLFVSIAMVMSTSVIAVLIIDSVDRSLITTGRADWTTEALLIANRLINSENCFAYVKKGVFYDVLHDGSVDYNFVDKITLPNSIDANKLSVERLKACTQLHTKEYYVFIGVKVYDESGAHYLLGDDDSFASYLHFDYFFNPNTDVNVVLPVKIIYDNRFSYGYVEVLISASAELFKARVL